MSVKIRLQRKGRKKRPYYHVVIADARAPRDGRFIERIGMYNPMSKPATIEIDRDKAYDWLMKGAQPTDTVRAILRFKGVLYKKHLMRGVKKGAMTQEDAEAKYLEFIQNKDAKIAARFEETAKERADWHSKISGVAPKIEPKVEETPVVEEAPAEEPVAEAPVVEEAPAEEPVAAAPVVEEAPAKADDLTKIEGIGPKIAEVLTNAGIPTFKALSEAEAEKIKEILTEAGGRFSMHDPTTWPEQAKMAFEGEWDKLKVWQDEHDGGKPKS